MLEVPFADDEIEVSEVLQVGSKESDEFFRQRRAREFQLQFTKARKSRDKVKYVEGRRGAAGFEHVVAHPVLIGHALVQSAYILCCPTRDTEQGEMVHTSCTSAILQSAK